MTVKNNLPPESQPWGRDIEKRLADLEFGNSVALNRNANTNDGVLATLKQLSSQLNTLNTTVSHLGSLSQSAANETTGFAWTTVGLGWTQISTNLSVPSGALFVDLIYSVEAVFTNNNAAGAGTLSTAVKAEIPTLSITSSQGPAVTIYQDAQHQRSRLYVASHQSISGYSSLTITGFGAMVSTGTNPNNSLKITALGIFSF